MVLFGKYARSPALSAVVAGAPDLESGAGGVRVVLLGGVVWMGTATRACGTGHQVDQAGCAVHAAITVYGHNHHMCWCVTNCVTITTYDNGLPWILRDA
jgi:hypothetical protein